MFGPKLLTVYKSFNYTMYLLLLQWCIKQIKLKKYALVVVDFGVLRQYLVQGTRVPGTDKFSNSIP